ncbi:hypothetical protein CoNPh26_CDS0015 [Staphylococcus phage S-CoN_Ph26]|nr:hypothetical protein CoNPh26_CDS0015 [Staphylococcus phage S-CoN_Ph26]
MYIVRPFHTFPIFCFCLYSIITQCEQDMHENITKYI